MTDMGLQLEPITQSLEPYGPWHLGDVRFQQHHRAELEAALLQTAAITGLSDTLREISKASRADCHNTARPEVTLSVSKTVQSGSPGPALPTAVTLAASSPKPETGWSLPPSAPSVFTQITPSGKELLVTFPLPPRPVTPKPCLKRRRPDTDVDGHNTAPLSCKKRRLRRRLITSRLSQPFSLPATHILTRESAATGGKRFVKLAAIMSARRLNSSVTTPSHGSSPQQHQQQQQPQQPSPSTWLRRAAVLNSLRGRVYAEAAERGHVPVSSDLAAKAAVFEQGHGAATAVVVGGRYFVHPAGSPAPPTPSPALSGSRGPPTGHRPAASLPQPTAPPRHPFPTPGGNTQPNHFPRPPPPAATFLPGTSAPTTAALLRPTTTPYPLGTTTATTTTTTTTTLPTTSTTSTSSMPPPPLPATHRLRIPSPTLRPLRSPELRVTRPPPCAFSPLDEEIRLGPGLHDHDEDEDDGVAFPTSALEGRYMCDDEDDDYYGDGSGEGGSGGEGRRERECVYADFSVIFGGGRAASDDGEGGEGGGGSDGGGEHYEDYMDDLDGIPWCARC